MKQMFKLQHPQDLISRLFILEYVKELGVDLVIDRLSEGERNFWVYKFEGDENIQYDFNWEYLLFVIPLSNLSKIMERSSIYSCVCRDTFQELSCCFC